MTHVGIKLICATWQGISFGVADGVGGWIDVGVDPSLFSQALMYHAHRYSKQAWAGEPEIDPLYNYEEREQVQGWELKPKECLELAHGAVLREKTVEAGKYVCELFWSCRLMTQGRRLKYCLCDQYKRVKRSASIGKVCLRVFFFL